MNLSLNLHIRLLLVKFVVCRDTLDIFYNKTPLIIQTKHRIEIVILITLPITILTKYHNNILILVHTIMVGNIILVFPTKTTHLHKSLAWKLSWKLLSPNILKINNIILSLKRCKLVHAKLNHLKSTTFNHHKTPTWKFFSKNLFLQNRKRLKSLRHISMR